MYRTQNQRGPLTNHKTPIIRQENGLKTFKVLLYPIKLSGFFFFLTQISILNSYEQAGVNQNLYSCDNKYFDYLITENAWVSLCYHLSSVRT